MEETCATNMKLVDDDGGRTRWVFRATPAQAAELPRLLEEVLANAHDKISEELREVVITAGLPDEWTDEEALIVFSEFGEVETVVLTGMKGPVRKRRARAVYCKSEDAARAAQELNGETYLDKTLVCRLGQVTSNSSSKSAANGEPEDDGSDDTDSDDVNDVSGQELRSVQPGHTSALRTSFGPLQAAVSAARRQCRAAPLAQRRNFALDVDKPRPSRAPTLVQQHQHQQHFFSEPEENAESMDENDIVRPSTAPASYLRAKPPPRPPPGTFLANQEEFRGSERKRRRRR